MWSLIEPLFTWRFWFNTFPTPFTPWIGKMILLFMLFLLIGGTTLVVYVRRFGGLDRERRKVLLQAAYVLGWGGLTGLLLHSLTWQMIPILSMRVFFLLWFVLVSWFLWMLAQRWTRDIPQRERERELRASYEKWLPKPKRS